MQSGNFLNGWTDEKPDLFQSRTLKICHAEQRVIIKKDALNGTTSWQGKRGKRDRVRRLQRWISEWEREREGSKRRVYQLQTSRETGEKRGGINMYYYGPSLERSFDICCKFELRLLSSPFLFTLFPSSSSSWSSSRSFSHTVHTHTHRAVQKHTCTAIVVCLWCIKTNISSPQINYQLSLWPASVISLSGSRSDGLSNVLPLPLHRPTAISSSAMVFQLLTPSLHHQHHHKPVPLMRGKRGRTCETITFWIGFLSRRIKSCFIMGWHRSPVSEVMTQCRCKTTCWISEHANQCSVSHLFFRLCLFLATWLSITCMYKNLMCQTCMSNKGCILWLVNRTMWWQSHMTYGCCDWWLIVLKWHVKGWMREKMTLKRTRWRQTVTGSWHWHGTDKYFVRSDCLTCWNQGSTFHLVTYIGHNEACLKTTSTLCS